jgi:hypothetical protein
MKSAPSPKNPEAMSICLNGMCPLENCHPDRSRRNLRFWGKFRKDTEFFLLSTPDEFKYDIFISQLMISTAHAAQHGNSTLMHAFLICSGREIFHKRRE